jgi:dTDP-glucose 4,6-dehydratase
VEIREAYKGRSVLITGADGFLGSHLTEALLAQGAEISILVRRPAHKLRYIRHLQDRLRIFQGDIRDYMQVHAAVRAMQDDRESIIFHLAAHTHVGESWEYPSETLRTNILGTVNLLWAIRETGIQLHRFAYAGSSEEYGGFDQRRCAGYHRLDDGKVLLNETAPINPKNVYATSKVAADFLAHNFFDAYDVPIVVTRMFNVFGPRQNPRFITGTVITQALERDTVEIGKPEGLRDFTYVDDAVEGLASAAACGEPGEVYVIGQGENISIGDWAKLILDVGRRKGFWRKRRLMSRPNRFRPGRTDEEELLADASRLRRLCGWKPSVSWDEGIARTIQWYAEHRTSWESMVDWR